MTSDRPHDGPVEIGRAGTPSAVILAVGVTGTGVTLALWAGWSVALIYPTVMALATAASVLFVVVTRRAHVIVISEDGIHVESPKTSVTYRWSELLEVGWARAVWPYLPTGLMVRAKGGPWDMPGPYAPVRVATLAVFGRRANSRARESLRQACARHGVAFAANGRRMGYDPPSSQG